MLVNIYDIDNQWLEQRQSNLPNELIYADDYDFITEDEKNKSMVIREVSKVLSSGNLLVNITKTEVITLKRSNNETERWRKIKKLGSLVVDKEDIKNRKKLANIPFTKLECIWLSKRVKETFPFKEELNCSKCLSKVYCSTIAASGE